jgi:hypothetical protein
MSSLESLEAIQLASEAKSIGKAAHQRLDRYEDAQKAQWDKVDKKLDQLIEFMHNTKGSQRTTGLFIGAVAGIAGGIGGSLLNLIMK